MMKVPKGCKMIPNVVEMGKHNDFHVVKPLHGKNDGRKEKTINN